MAAKIPLRKIVIAGALGAVAVVLGITRLGFIPGPLGPGAELTVMCVPVIVGAVLEGPIVGAAIGLIFGVFSMIQDTSGFFKNPLVAILPRMLVGIVAWLVFLPFSKRLTQIGAAIAGVAGSLTNTVLVLGGLVLLYSKTPPTGQQPFSMDTALLVGRINGPLEAAIAIVLTMLVVIVWRGIESSTGKARLANEGKK